MAQPAGRRRDALREEPPVDPTAVPRAYRHAKARRRARIEHRRETRRARLRFWFFLLALLGASLFLALTVWSELQDLFGL
jgi:hypothetical protein